MAFSRPAADDGRSTNVLPARSPPRHDAPRPDLSPEQSADTDRVHAALLAAASDLRHLTETLAAATDETVFGADEFVVRGTGAEAVEVALSGREKKLRRV